MHTTPAPAVVYSALAAGSRTRVMATRDGATRALVTCRPETAEKLIAALTALAADRRDDLYAYAQAHPAQRCYLRRTFLSALASTATSWPTGSGPWAGPRAGTALLAAAAACTEAERRAVAEEVGRLYADTETVLVPVCLVDDYMGQVHATLANGWLATELTYAPTAEGREEVCSMLVEVLAGDSAPLYEGLLAHLRSAGDTEAATVNQLAGRHSLDVQIDEAALVAWMRIELVEHLDELEEFVGDAD